MNILELDAGNTRLKWRVKQGGQVVHRGFLNNDECWQTKFKLILSEVGRLDWAVGSVVSGSDRSELLASILLAQAGVELELVKTRNRWQGLTLNYQHPLKLGTDRWLAMLAACQYAVRGARIVVNSGTALTVDLVDAAGQHLGGYIVPGQRLMRQSLQAETAQLGISYEPAQSIDPGNKTIDCINQGVLAMAVAMINRQAEAFNDTVVFLTGGDAPQLQPYIKAECLCEPELVMNGLELASGKN